MLFSSLEHAFTTLGHDIVVVARAAAPVLKVIDATAPVVEAITGLINPAAEPIELAAYAALGKLCTALSATQTAVAAVVTEAAPGQLSHAVTLNLTPQELQQFMDVAAALQAELGKKVTPQ